MTSTRTRASECTVTTAALTTVARVQGPTDGPTVLFLHAIALDRREADPLADALPAVRVVSFDQRGHGEAMASDDRSMTIEVLANDALDIAAALGLEDFHLVGHSMGGAVAGTAAGMASRSARGPVASLTLIATPSGGGPIFAARADSLTEKTRDVVIETTLERWFTAPALTEQGPGVTYATACLRQMPVSQWQQAWMALSGFEGFDDLSQAAEPPIPALLISDQDDASTPPSVLDTVARSIGTGEHVVLSGGGHMLVLETPAAVADALIRHIERTEK